MAMSKKQQKTCFLLCFKESMLKTTPRKACFRLDETMGTVKVVLLLESPQLTPGYSVESQTGYSQSQSQFGMTSAIAWAFAVAERSQVMI